MIQANDLRIGNRFIRELRTPRGMEYDHDFVLTEEMMGKLFGDNIEIALQDLFPIPLTPEILEKAGFVLEGDTGYYRKMFAYADSTYPCYLLYSLENEYIQVCRNFIAAADAPCKYLHQLQNLIFALTAQELTINL